MAPNKTNILLKQMRRALDSTDICTALTEVCWDSKDLGDIQYHLKEAQQHLNKAEEEIKTRFTFTSW